MASLRTLYSTQPSEPSRVRRSSSGSANARIDEMLKHNIRFYQNASRHNLSARIVELEREWSIERWLETNASTLALVGVLLAARGHPRAMVLSGTVLSFLLLHGVSGWCPPLPILRRVGVRTRAEIDLEKFALKYLRGDFERLESASRSGSLTAELIAEAMTEAA